VNDDRVLCNECKNLGKRISSESMHIDRARRIRQLGRKIKRPNERMSVEGDWIKLEYVESYCAAGLVPLPNGPLHRCGEFE
jgi:hypothetical protein